MAADDTNPKDFLATGDPGDETQRNFRYQNAYGAILLIAGACLKEPYNAIWCEHHEDLLAERNDNLFDAFQIKTRQPERGYWKMADSDIVGSIKRFVKLEEQFGDRIRLFGFVSNANFYKCQLNAKETELVKSPIRFLEAVHSSDKFSSLTKYNQEKLSSLSTECDCDDDKMFGVLKKIYFKKGPSRDDFDAEIAHNHLPQFSACNHMNQAALNAVRDELIQAIYQASSLKVDDPARYLVNIEARTDPVSVPFFRSVPI